MSFAELRDIGNVNEAKVWFNPSLRSQKSGNNIVYLPIGSDIYFLI